MTLEEAQALAIEIKDCYQRSNEQSGTRQWDARALADGLLVDIAALVKMLMIRDGFRDGDASEEKLAHELGDIVWSAFAIADELGVDLSEQLPLQLRALRSRFPQE